MSRQGRMLGALLGALFLPSMAAAAPGQGDTATLRCVYKRLGDPTGAATASIDLAGAPLRGQWRHERTFAWSNLFYTDVTPADVRAHCEARLRQQPDAHRLVSVRATGVKDTDPYAYEIWHRGDLRPGATIERIVTFGDSLTDTGNMELASRQVLSNLPVGTSLPSPSWFAGRFSNGPTWAEYLASRNGLVLNNWAVGGAQTRNANVFIHGIDTQIRRFFEHMKSAPDYNPSRTLFTFMVAGNDFVNDSKYSTQIVQLQRDSLLELVRHGARKILVVNLPDVTAAPVFRLGRTDAESVRRRVDVYNSALAGIVANVSRQARQEGIVTNDNELQIRVVDARSRFDQVLAQPDRYGFTNTMESCLRIDEDSSLTYIQRPAPRKHCQADRFVFWDSLHPTTRMHELMAGWAVETAPPGWGLR